MSFYLCTEQYSQFCVTRTYSMRQKIVSIIIQYNTIWFRHIQPKTERKPRAMPFYNVSFRYCTVPFRCRSVPCAEYRTESKCRFFSPKKARLAGAPSASQTCFRALGLLLTTRRSLGTRFSKVSVAPRSLIACAFDGICRHSQGA